MRCALTTRAHHALPLYPSKWTEDVEMIELAPRNEEVIEGQWHFFLNSEVNDEIAAGF